MGETHDTPELTTGWLAGPPVMAAGSEVLSRQARGGLAGGMGVIGVSAATPGQNLGSLTASGLAVSAPPGIPA